MNLLDPWILAFYALMYVTIHNFNYSYWKVNQTHYKHHLNPFTNIGPDICDILFNSKAEDDEVEDTDHFIPNTIIVTAFLFAVKQLVDISIILWLFYLFCILSLLCGLGFYFSEVDCDLLKKCWMEFYYSGDFEKSFHK